MEPRALAWRRVGGLVAIQQQIFGVVGYGVDDFEEERGKFLSCTCTTTFCWCGRGGWCAGRLSRRRAWTCTLVALCNFRSFHAGDVLYAMALMGVAVPWKKYITQLQLLQFVVVFCHAVYVLLYTKCLKILPYSQMLAYGNILVLFGNFYAEELQESVFEE